MYYLFNINLYWLINIKLIIANIKYIYMTSLCIINMRFRDS